MSRRIEMLAALALGVVGALVWAPALAGAHVTRADHAQRIYAPRAPLSAQNPAFSPRGSAILFTRFHRGYGSGGAGVYRLSLASGGATRVLDERGQDAVNLPGSCWNACGRIVFSSDRRDRDEIWTATPSGGGLTRVTSHAGAEHRIEPSFSPDGEWIVFEVRPDGAAAQGSIWKVRRDGSELTQLSDGPAMGTDDRQPNWSPAGDEIVFQRRAVPGGVWQLYVMRADGSEMRQLTDGPAEDTDACWSPDGRWVVFSSDRGGLENPNLFVVSSAGAEVHRLTTAPGREDSAPSWSPGGTWVAFESRRGGDAERPAALWRIRVPRSLWSAPAWTAVDDWLYQLQGLRLTRAGDSRFDLVVMDYSRDGGDATRYTAAEVAALRTSVGGPKRVLAYLSIGEAEDYRWYWQDSWDADHDGTPDPGAPTWLGPSNPDWPGCYKVRYWDPAWQALVFGSPDAYLDKIIAAGYDGAYLDIVDAYEYWGPGGESGLDRPTAEQEMVDFVRALAVYARDVKGAPGFGVFPQNGADLASHLEYLPAVTGIGAEDTWYDGDRAQPVSETIYVVQRLNAFRRAGKLVLCVDYCRRAAHIDRFYARARDKGVVPYATVRDLDRLVVNAGHPPD